MMIFFDTDTLSYSLTGNAVICGKIQEALDDKHQICLTIINVYEIIKGLRYKNNKNKELLLKKFITNVSVFSLDNNTIQKAADIYADLRKKGVTIGDADIFIAAIVMTHNGKLITNNTRHYQNIDGLEIENWNI